MTPGIRRKGTAKLPLTYFPQVEEPIWNEFSGPIYAMKACSGTASSQQRAQSLALQGEANHCTCSVAISAASIFDRRRKSTTAPAHKAA